MKKIVVLFVAGLLAGVASAESVVIYDAQGFESFSTGSVHGVTSGYLLDAGATSSGAFDVVTGASSGFSVVDSGGSRGNVLEINGGGARTEAYLDIGWNGDSSNPIFSGQTKYMILSFDFYDSGISSGTFYTYRGGRASAQTTTWLQGDSKITGRLNATTAGNTTHDVEPDYGLNAWHTAQLVTTWDATNAWPTLDVYVDGVRWDLAGQTNLFYATWGGVQGDYDSIKFNVLNSGAKPLLIDDMMLTYTDEEVAEPPVEQESLVVYDSQGFESFSTGSVHGVTSGYALDAGATSSGAFDIVNGATSCFSVVDSGLARGNILEINGGGGRTEAYLDIGWNGDGSNPILSGQTKYMILSFDFYDSGVSQGVLTTYRGGRLSLQTTAYMESSKIQGRLNSTGAGNTIYDVEPDRGENEWRTAMLITTWNATNNWSTQDVYVDGVRWDLAGQTNIFYATWNGVQGDYDSIKFNVLNSSTRPFLIDDMTLTYANHVEVPVSDGDGDGLPDVWEKTYFGSTNELANADTDADTYSNSDEYIAGTDPADGSSVFEVWGDNSGSEPVVGWTSLAGRYYSVFWTTNLIDGFTSLTNQLEYPQNMFTDTLTDDEPAGFYKVEVQLK